MEKDSVPTETDPQTLQDRLKDLEQQLAEAQKTIQMLASPQNNETLKHLELLFAQSRDIILFIRPGNGQILDANDAATRAYGYSRDELLDLTIYDLRAPDTISQIAAQMEQASSGNLLFETVHRRKDGSTFPVEVSSQVAIEGSDRTLISIIRDISGRKQIEQEREQLFLEAQQQKEKFSKAFQASPEALVISRMMDGRIVEINESFGRLFGYSREEVIGKTSLQLEMFVNPLDRVEALERMREQGSLRGFDLFIRTRTGEEHPASLSIEKININHEDHLLTILHDLTERKRLEGAIRKERDRAAWLARLPDENPSPVVRVAANGIVLYHNPAAAELPEWACAVDQPLPEPLLHMVIRAMAHSREVEQDVQLGERYYLVSVMPIPDEAYANLYGRDITDRKQAEQALQDSETRYRQLSENAAEFSRKLERSNRELEQFAFAASHDLQEPLRKIEAFGDSLLESATKLDDRGRKYVERMRNAAGRMRDMVDGLLQLSRVTTQGKPFIPVDLSRIAADVLSDLEYQIRRTGGRVEISDLPGVEGDPMQLHQLLQNLIGNALKYHRLNTPPVVKVHARQLPGHIQISVEDNGIGFDPNQAEQMFQPFQRLVGRNEFEGSGIGLAICRRIVERHGGDITARGELGLGATFFVTLPVSEWMVEEG